ncbi:MAG: hypothetical protein NUV67_05320 [archaeon]|nr:hypothetical protein [archaeon]
MPKITAIWYKNLGFAILRKWGCQKSPVGKKTLKTAHPQRNNFLKFYLINKKNNKKEAQNNGFTNVFIVVKRFF